MRNEFDLSVDEGTFDDYETFGVYSEDAPEGAVPEYEIFMDGDRYAIVGRRRTGRWDAEGSR